MSPLDANRVDQVVHAIDAPQQCGLAATGGTDQRRHLALGDRHADVEQRLLLAVPEIEVLDLEDGLLLMHVIVDDGFDRFAAGDGRQAVRSVVSGGSLACTRAGPVSASRSGVILEVGGIGLLTSVIRQDPH